MHIAAVNLIVQNNLRDIRMKVLLKKTDMDITDKKIKGVSIVYNTFLLSILLKSESFYEFYSERKK
jgi:hypothetical protein